MNKCPKGPAYHFHHKKGTKCCTPVKKVSSQVVPQAHIHKNQKNGSALFSRSASRSSRRYIDVASAPLWYGYMPTSPKFLYMERETMLKSAIREAISIVLLTGAQRMITRSLSQPKFTIIQFFLVGWGNQQRIPYRHRPGSCNTSRIILRRNNTIDHAPEPSPSPFYKALRLQHKTSFATVHTWSYMQVACNLTLPTANSQLWSCGATMWHELTSKQHVGVLSHISIVLREMALDLLTETQKN